MKIKHLILFLLLVFSFSQAGAVNRVRYFLENKNQNQYSQYSSPNAKTPQKRDSDRILDIKKVLAKTGGAVPKGANCWQMAANRYDLPAYLLYSMALVESSMRPHAVGINKNGTSDIGLMQINSSWKKTLAKHDISMNDLKNSCINIHVGAWILKDNFNRMGYTWKAIGAYNAITSYKHQKSYANDVYKMYALVMQSKKTGELFRDPIAPRRAFDKLKQKKR